MHGCEVEGELRAGVCESELKLSSVGGTLVRVRVGGEGERERGREGERVRG